MDDAIYKDIRLVSDDLNLVDGQAEIIYDVDVIVQDLINAIRESGYLVKLVAERSEEKRQLLLLQIVLLVEDDDRIVPGTIEITASEDNFTAGQGQWTLTATTYDFGDIEVELTA